MCCRLNKPSMLQHRIMYSYKCRLSIHITDTFCQSIYKLIMHSVLVLVIHNIVIVFYVYRHYTVYRGKVSTAYTKETIATYWNQIQNQKN